MSEGMTAGMRRHWSKPAVRARRAAGVVERRHRQRLESEVAGLENAIASWAGHDPEEVMPGGRTLGDKLECERRKIAELRKELEG